MSRVISSVNTGAAEVSWPEKLTPELSDILGRQCFTFINLCQLYRAAGVDIKTRAEDEQAYFLHKMLSYWFKHGPNWAVEMQKEIEETLAAAKAQGSQ